MIIAVLIFFSIIFIAFFGVLVLTFKISESCKHSYERIDDYNDKKMILVCRRCGKIKTLRK